MRRFMIYLALAFLLCPLVGAQESQMPVETLQELATKALPTFGKLITETNSEAMGFASTKDVAMAKLSDTEPPLQEFTIRLDHLKAYVPDSVEPKSLLTGGERALYPVMVGESVGSSVGLAKVKGAWAVVSMGNPNLARLATEVRRTCVDSLKVEPGAAFAVEVPALSVYFIGFYSADKLMLVSIQDWKEYGFTAGVAMPATEALAALLPAAREHDGGVG